MSLRACHDELFRVYVPATAGFLKLGWGLSFDDKGGATTEMMMVVTMGSRETRKE